MDIQPDSNKQFPDTAMSATTRVIEESGRWVVMLNVDFWEPEEEEGNPINSVWKRINDYSTQQEAETAATWIGRAANRNLSHPPTGF